MRHLILALPFALLTALPLAAQDNPIVSQITAFVAAYNAGDAAAIEGFYTEDAVLFPPGMGHLAGRARIGDLYEIGFQNGTKNLRYDILEIKGYGPDAAVEISLTQVTEQGREVQGRSMHVWQRVDGNWLITRDIFNVIKVGD